MSTSKSVNVNAAFTTRLRSTCTSVDVPVALNAGGRVTPLLLYPFPKVQVVDAVRSQDSDVEMDTSAAPVDVPVDISGAWARSI
eukprot:IDg23728t1